MYLAGCFSLLLLLLPLSAAHRSSDELHQFISMHGALQTILPCSQIMADNSTIMTKALLAVGSPRGQPALRRVFMLSHIPIIAQWQRQKLANVHQGASLLEEGWLGRGTPLKLSSR